MASFSERLKQAMGTRGYDQSQRRSIQTCVLFETNRVLGTKLKELRPFQRKIAYWDMANYLVQSTDLMPHQKEEIMWRTATSKEPLQPDTAWKRGKNLEKELKLIVESIKPFLAGRSHEEACHAFLQNQWEEANNAHKGKAYPQNWQFSHNNCFLCYKMFYRGTALNPHLPPAEPPKAILVPQERPPKDAQTIVLAPASASAESAMTSMPQPHTTSADAVAAATAAANKEHDLNEADLESIVRTDGGRAGVLQEVRQHLELLKEFEGIIPQEEINNRKRDLYLALPPAPPPHIGGESAPPTPSRKGSTPKRARKSSGEGATTSAV